MPTSSPVHQQRAAYDTLQTDSDGVLFIPYPEALRLFDGAAGLIAGRQIMMELGVVFK